MSDDWSSTGFLEANAELEASMGMAEQNKFRDRREKERQKERAKVEKEKESEEGESAIHVGCFVDSLYIQISYDVDPRGFMLENE